MNKTLLHLDKEDLQLLHGKMQLGRVKSGQVLVKEGVLPLGLFIVREGSVLVQRNINGYTITTATLGINEMFGETAFVSPRPATASVVAADDTDVIVLTPRRLQPLFDENPGLFGRFHRSLAHVLSRRLRAFNEQTGGPKKDRFGDLPSWEIL
ncbi:MAG: cyclic nucleotide-binding domain-containing protein [Proteobacteria bacterium]|nr:cyclic nucleotide-binding domain-containing protein [Pseudomonadota bacterium]